MGYGFICKYCGKAFGNHPDKLEEHISYECTKDKNNKINQISIGSN